MGSGFTMCVRQAHNDAAMKRNALRSELKGKTASITEAWKTGFAALKSENDQMQRDLKEAFNSRMQMNDESMGDMEEALQK